MKTLLGVCYNNDILLPVVVILVTFIRVDTVEGTGDLYVVGVEETLITDVVKDVLVDIKVEEVAVSSVKDKMQFCILLMTSFHKKI